MKFILVSRHTDGSEIPAGQGEQTMKDLGEWVTMLKATAMPIRGGKVVTATTVEDYAGDIGGVLIFEADSLDQAVVMTKMSPGLKFGFTHEVFPEISMEQAASTS
jgi:hypothetical protein